MCHRFKISGLLSQMMREKRWKSHLALIQMRSPKTVNLLPSFPESTWLRQKPQGVTSLTPRVLGIAEALSKKNFQNIRTFLTGRDKINAVVVLLKSNSASLTDAFKLCVSQLLTHDLIKSLVTNIIFAFTNSRGTFYRPGDTLPVLKQLLKDTKIHVILSPKTYFCFDNEAFRYYLISVKYGCNFWVFSLF